MAEPQNTRVEREPNGRWKPGSVPNPGGRPKAEVSLTAVLREQAAALREDGQTVAQALAAKLLALALAGDVAALRYAYDRLEGSPTQRREDITPEVIRERVEKLAAELKLDAPTLMAEYLRLREAS